MKGARRRDGQIDMDRTRPAIGGNGDGLIGENVNGATADRKGSLVISS